MSDHLKNNDYKINFAEEFQLYDEDKERLRFTGNEDVQIHLRAFKARMKVLGHEGVTSDDDDLLPVRPHDAYARRANGIETPNDTKAISYYQRELVAWNKSCAFVCLAWLDTLDQKTVQTLEGEIEDLREPSREKWFEMVRVVQLRFGGWTKFKGDRNLLAIEEVPKFTSVATAYSGLTAIMKLKRERDSFANPQAGIYNDAFYIPWLIERMDIWDKLSHLRYKFQHNTVNVLTFAQMRIELLAELKLLEDENQKLGGKLHTAYMARMSGKVPKQSESDRVLQQPADFTGNVATSDSEILQHLHHLQAQVASMRSPPQDVKVSASPYRRSTPNYGNTRGPPTTTDHVICRSCGGRGHIRSQCPSNRNQPYDKGQSTSGVGAKRKQDSDLSSGRPSPYKAAAFDPNSCKYPPRGTGAPRSTDYRAAAAYDGAEGGPTGDDYTLEAHRAELLWQQQEDEEADDR